MSSARTLFDLPLELADAILDCVDAPSDVLSLARTCKTLHALAVPDHLHYRHIFVRACATEGALWAHLAAHPRRARAVRVLRIGGKERVGPPEVISTTASLPDGVGLEPELEVARGTCSPGAVANRECVLRAQAALIKALRHMSGLQEVLWDSGEHAWYEHDDWVWHALRRAGAPLKRLRAGVTTRNAEFDNDGATVRADSSLYDLTPSTLTHLSLRLGLDSRELVNTTRLSHLLSSSSSLHTLALRFGYRAYGRADLSPVLRVAKLPALRRLVLDDVGADALSVRAFLLAHSELEELHVCAAPRFDLDCLALLIPVDCENGGAATVASPEAARKPAVVLPKLTSYAPVDAHRLAEVAASGAAPALTQVVLSGRQLYLARHEVYRESWARALRTVPGLKSVGLWDPYDENEGAAWVGLLPEGVQVEKATKCPWYYEDLD